MCGKHLEDFQMAMKFQENFLCYFYDAIDAKIKNSNNFQLNQWIMQLPVMYGLHLTCLWVIAFHLMLPLGRPAAPVLLFCWINRGKEEVT